MNWQWLSRFFGHQAPDFSKQYRDLTANKGSVVLGEASGSKITINNISVPESHIRRYSRQLPLPKGRAEAVCHDFLKVIENYYRYLPLKGMGDNSSFRVKFSLVDLFVPLNARLTIPQGDRLPQHLRVAGRDLPEEEREQLGGKLDDLKPVLALSHEYPVLVVLGDPGSGKSTVLRFLAFVLATGQAKKLGLGDYLPLLLPLADYSEKLVQNPAMSLACYAREYFCDRLDLEALDVLLDTYLEKGKVLILLDGLDEVKEVSQRHIVVQRVEMFLSRYVDKGNRVLMTSRIVGYREVRPPEVQGLRECTLLDFEMDEIRDFIRRWTGVLESHAYTEQRVAEYEARREYGELIEAVQSNKAVRDLAANPLLLTMLVIQKRQGSSLPRHRVVLYERYINSLMYDWLLARSEHKAPHQLPNERHLRRMLEPLAWWLQQSEPGKGLVAEVDLLGWLQKQPALAGEDSDEKAHRFIADVRQHSGLLIDRGGRKFGFLHLTFMEYLAGVHLAKKLQYDDGLEQVAGRVRRYAGVSEWREVLLLALGHIGLNQGQELSTTRLLQGLLQPGQAAEVQAIAAEALADIGEDGVLPENMDAFKAHLQQGLCGQLDLPAPCRVVMGRSLAQLGDPRPEVNSVDATPFCYVPAGAFYMGRGQHDKEEDGWIGEETPAGEYDLTYGYWLAQHPITQAQFQQFVTESDFQVGDDDALKGDANAPVVYVSQQEALAFCEWLTKRWQGQGWISPEWRVSLPNEPEWEKAARGGLEIPEQPCIRFISAGGFDENLKPVMTANPEPQRRYPWGNKIDSEQCNYKNHVQGTSALGAYGNGVSPAGCYDLAGNVWEWTRSRYADYPYPVAGSTEWQQREAGAGDKVGVVLRGGAFSGDRSGVRCAVRVGLPPDSRYGFVGFRVVLSPLL